MSPFNRVSGGAGVCFAGALLLIVGLELFGLGERYDIWPAWLGASVSSDALVKVESWSSWLLLAACMFAAPSLAYVSFAKTADARGLRSYLSVVPGVAVSAALTAIAVVVFAGEMGPGTAHLVLTRVLGVLSQIETGTMLLGMAIAVALAGGRAAAGSGAAVAAPVVLLTASASINAQSILLSSVAALVPFLLFAAVLGAAAIVGGGRWRFTWALGCVPLVLFALALMPGLVTPRELMAVAVIPALIIALAIHASIGQLNVWQIVTSAVLEGAGIVLALVGISLSMTALALMDLAEVPAGLMPLDPVPALAIVLGVYFVLAAIVTPMVALVVAPALRPSTFPCPAA